MFKSLVLSLATSFCLMAVTPQTIQYHDKKNSAIQASATYSGDTAQEARILLILSNGITYDLPLISLNNQGAYYGRSKTVTTGDILIAVSLNHTVAIVNKVISAEGKCESEYFLGQDGIY